MTRTEAIALLRAGTAADRLGTKVEIAGVPLAGVRRSLTVEELAQFGAGEIRVEGFRLTYDPAELGYDLHLRERIEVDGQEYEVAQIDYPGGNCRVTFIRYLG